MKLVKVLATAFAAVLMTATAQTASAQINLQRVASTAAVLTSSQAQQIGSSLLQLYTNYKAAGKFDIKDAKNVTALMLLAKNVADLSIKDKPSFVSDLIKGSNNLVTEKNSDTVIDTLQSLSQLNLTQNKSNSNLGSAASLLTGLFSKI